MARRFAALTAVGLWACGPAAQGASPDADAPPAAAPLLPLEVGNRWTYRITFPGGGSPAEKTTTVVERRALDGAKEGVEALVVESVTGAVKSVVFLEVRDGMVVRHREDGHLNGRLTDSKLLTPFSLRGPEATATAGQTWHERFVEEVFGPDGALRSAKTNDYDWRVESADEPLAVPAGSFATVRLSRIKPGSGRDKTVWLAPGVGKVREDDAGVIEVLTGFQVR